MKFRTEIDIKKADIDITYGDRLFFVGSCFTTNLGGALQQLKFPAVVNPTGVLYNPASISMMLQRLIDKQLFTADDVFCEGGVWNSFQLHSCFSSLSADELLKNANQSVSEASDFLKSADILFITLGTSWVYSLVADGCVVANCHKRPAAEFNRTRLSVDDVVGYLLPVLQQLSEQNAKLKVIFTVSPIRHWKDGAHGNQLSKSTLMLAIDLLQELLPEVVSYFPAYELLMDDLRDYRFYADDLLHPSDAAVSYIFDKFQDAYFSDKTRQQMKQVQSVVAAACHRPFNPDSFDYKRFCSHYLNIIDDLKKSLPKVDFSAEKLELTPVSGK